jgi:hypothetical protein
LYQGQPKIIVVFSAHTRRLVFNPRRNSPIAVPENARSCGKGRQAGRQRRQGSGRPAACAKQLDPATTQKRLGDGFYEQRLLTEQIASLTGRRFLAGYGRMSGSVSASSSKIESDYASVTEQSAIRAGDKGFDVDVKGDTDLKGSAITSTQKAIDDKLNQFKTGGELTTSDIENKAEYKAKSASVNVGTSLSFDGALKPGGTSAGFGKDGDKAESMTLAAISDIAGNKGARTGDAETGIQKIFDQEKVQKEIDAQTRITQQFGQLAPEAWGKHANTKFADALKTGDEEGMRCWGPDGACRAGGHAVLGGLAGGVGGAVGAGLSSVAAPHVQAYLVDQGLPPAAASAVTQLAAIGAGSAVGGTAGATGAFNEASNNALILAVPLAAEIMAGGAVAIRACVMSPACQKAVMLAGVATLDKMVSMLPKEEQSLVPGYGAGTQPPQTGPLVTPMPDPKKMQELYGTPPLQNPEQLRSWLASALEGYPADEAEKWARDLIRTFPAAEQQRYSDLIIQQVHHICTDKNCVSPNSGGPWTPEFRKMFDKAGLSMQDELNKVWVAGHQGPHPAEYHREVFRRLNLATRGQTGDAYSQALKDELSAIGKDIQTPGSDLNKLVTKK